MTKKNQQHVYDQLQANLYAEIGITGTYKITFDKLKEVLNKINIKGKRWLDFGCGPGRSTRFLADLGANAVGIDKSEEMFYKAKEKHQDLKFYLSDERLNGRLGLFDGALSAFVFLEMSSKSDMNEALKLINRLLKPGAPFILATINPFTVGKEFESWIHQAQDLKNLKSGDPIICKIISSYELKVTDYYWTDDDYKNVLEHNNFYVENILMNTKGKTVINSKSHDENDAWLIIQSRKSTDI